MKAIECPFAIRTKSLKQDWTSALIPLYRRASFRALLRNAQVAQLVEHVTENHGVGGSIPPLGTILLQCSKERFTRYQARASALPGLADAVAQLMDTQIGQARFSSCGIPASKKALIGLLGSGVDD